MGEGRNPEKCLLINEDAHTKFGERNRDVYFRALLQPRADSSNILVFLVWGGSVQFEVRLLEAGGSRRAIGPTRATQYTSGVMRGFPSVPLCHN